MDIVEQMHSKLHKHAFDCGGAFRQAYNEIQAEGLGHFAARKHAIRKHDQAVTWVNANVGLD